MVIISPKANFTLYPNSVTLNKIQRVKRKWQNEYSLFYALPCVSALSERTAISFHSSQRN